MAPRPQFYLLVTSSAEGLAVQLEALAKETGCQDFARAARALKRRTGTGGRPPKKDRALIAEAQHLLETGAVPNLHRALLQVARTVSGRQSERSIAERLRRKMQNLPTKRY